MFPNTKTLKPFFRHCVRPSCNVSPRKCQTILILQYPLISFKNGSFMGRPNRYFEGPPAQVFPVVKNEQNPWSKFVMAV